jgi:hypothetical protein
MNNTKKLQYRVSEEFYNQLKEYQKVKHVKLSPIIRNYLNELVLMELEQIKNQSNI